LGIFVDFLATTERRVQTATALGHWRRLGAHAQGTALLAAAILLIDADVFAASVVKPGAVGRNPIHSQKQDRGQNKK